MARGSWEGKRLTTMVIWSLLMLHLVIEHSGVPFRVDNEATRWTEATVMESNMEWEESKIQVLAEMEERQDSVVYRTDNHNADYERRQWEEREKEKKSWDMLKNMIIDGRQPPRRFSEPPRSGNSQ